MHRPIFAVLALTFMVLASASAALPVTPDHLVDASQRNAQELRHYTWKMQMETTLQDALQPVKLYAMRYDDNGNLQKSLLSDKPDDTAAWYAIRGRIKKKRARELSEWTARLAEVVKLYTTPTRGQLLDFYTKARSTSTADGTVRFTALGFLEPDDTATFWIDPATRTPSRFGFATTLDGFKVLGEVEYGQLTDGTCYARKVRVEVPEKKVRALVETFDYVRQ